MRAEIIAIGSELLTPFRLDTNSLKLTSRLNALGIEVSRKVVVGDDRQTLDAAVVAGISNGSPADILILMGGLGPTEEAARERVNELADKLVAALGDSVFSENNEV